MLKVLLDGPKLGGKSLMNAYIEQTILRNENFITHIRGADNIGTLQRILMNKQQVITGARGYIVMLPYIRYKYCKHNEVKFLWDQLSALNIKMAYIMEEFIDKGYSSKMLEVLNSINIHMKVVVLSEISKYNYSKMAQWAIKEIPNRNSRWIYTQRWTPTPHNLKVWRDCIRRAFMK